MEQGGTGQHFKELFIEDIQTDLNGTHHPVGHGVCLEVHTTVFVAAGHLVYLIHLFRLTAEGTMSGRTEST